MKEIFSIHTKDNSAPVCRSDTFFFTSSGRRLRISLLNITHISSEMETVFIYTRGSKYPTAYELSDIHSALPSHLFYRVHPLHVVALQHVRGMDKKEVMVGDHRLFTTRYYRSRLVEQLNNRKVHN